MQAGRKGRIKAGRNRTGGWILLGILCIFAAVIIFLRGTVDTDKMPDSMPGAEKKAVAYSPPAADTKELPVLDTGEKTAITGEAMPKVNESTQAVDMYRPVFKEQQPVQSGAAETGENVFVPSAAADTAQGTASPVPATPLPVQTTPAPAPATPDLLPPVQDSTGSSYQAVPQSGNETPRI